MEKLRQGISVSNINLYEISINRSPHSSTRKHVTSSPHDDEGKSLLIDEEVPYRGDVTPLQLFGDNSGYQDTKPILYILGSCS